VCSAPKSARDATRRSTWQRREALEWQGLERERLGEAVFPHRAGVQVCLPDVELNPEWELQAG